MRSHHLVGVLLVVIGSLVTTAQQNRVMTFEDVVTMKLLMDAQISPDGKSVAYVVRATSLLDNSTDSSIWLVAAEGGQPVRLTAGRTDAAPRWSPGSNEVIFRSARDGAPQLYMMAAAGGEATRLTDSRTPVGAFSLSPDGGRVAYIAQDEPSLEEVKRQKDRDDAQVVDKQLRTNSLWLVDTQTRKPTRLLGNMFLSGEPQWSPDGRFLLYTTVRLPKADDDQSSDLWVVDAGSGKARKLTENEGPDKKPRWSPDGRQIVYVTAPDARSGLLAIEKVVVVPSQGGTPRVLLSGRGPDKVEQPEWPGDGRWIYISAPVRATTQLFAVPAAGGEPKQVTQNAGWMQEPTFSADGAVMAFVHSDGDHPPEVYVAKLAPPFTPVRLTDHNAVVRTMALGRVEVIQWKSTDGTEVEGILTYPVGYRAGKRYPTLVLPRTVPSSQWLQDFSASYLGAHHAWAGKGWVVLRVNHRGSVGYGEKFKAGSVGDWGGRDYQDVLSGVDHLIAKGIADSGRLALSSWANGGLLAAMAVTRTNRFKAVTVGSALTDLVSLYYTTDIPSTLEAYVGGDPWSNPQGYRRASAVPFLDQAKRTPTLILAGGADTRVGIGQAQALYMGLRKAGVPTELVTYPREGIWLREPRHQLDKLTREHAWFEKHVLGSVQGSR